jgi:hypothetical protein
MRTIKFLGLVAAMAVAALPARAQGNLQPGQFPAVDRLARIEANRLVHRQQLREMRAQRQARMQGHGRFARAHGVRAGIRAGARAGFRAGLRAGRLDNATPEQKAFVEQLRTQRQSVRAQVLEGKLTREQARAQMRAWITEHRPKK